MKSLIWVLNFCSDLDLEPWVQMSRHSTRRIVKLVCFVSVSASL